MKILLSAMLFSMILVTAACADNGNFDAKKFWEQQERWSK